MSSEISVTVASALRSKQSATVVDGRASENQKIDAISTSKTSATLEGAEIKASCVRGDQTYVLLALDRRAYAAAAQARLSGKCSEIATLEKKAADASSERRHLDAAASLAQAAVLAAAVEEESPVARVVSRGEVTVQATPSVQLRRRATEQAAQTLIEVQVGAGPGADALRRQAMSCLSRSGIGTAEGSATPNATLTLVTRLDPPASAIPGFFVVRGHLSGSMKVGESTAVVASASEVVVGGGDSPGAAAQDAMRMLGADAVPKVLDEIIRSRGWKVELCSSGTN